MENTAKCRPPGHETTDHNDLKKKKVTGGMRRGWKLWHRCDFLPTSVSYLSAWWGQSLSGHTATCDCWPSTTFQRFFHRFWQNKIPKLLQIWLCLPAVTQRTPLQSANDRVTGRCAEVGAADANPKIHGERRSDTARSGKEPVSGSPTGKAGTDISTRNPNSSVVCFGAAPSSCC